MNVAVAVCNATQLLLELSDGITVKQEQKDISISGKLTIPEYQRPYCWGPKQISSLINDLQEHKKNPGNYNAPYYLGSIILHRKEGVLNIIDGQQRVTTLALMMHLLRNNEKIDLSYESPISQKNISENLNWLKNNQAKLDRLIEFDNLELSLVITDSEDDAYRFFETQNTGGVRLSGPDIIKAHHLRVVKNSHRGVYARQWERLGDINSVVLALLRGRFWQKLQYQEIPSHREPKLLRDVIVEELAQRTGNGGDIAYGQFKRVEPIVAL